MRTMTPTILLVIACVTACAQETQQRGMNLEQRFKRLDSNGDGKVTRDEARGARWFDRLDRDGDGVITLEEVRGRGKRPVGDSKAAAQAATRSDVAYGEDDAQRLDIYAPENAKHAPVMVYVHGGGWKRGDKSAVGQKAVFFPGKGWVFVSVNYRLLPEGKHPANVRDVARALAWVHDHIAEHGGDPDRLFLMGHSAGCHLASLVATDGRHLEKTGKPLRLVKGVIALDTNTYDLRTLMKSNAARFYEQVFGSDPEVWRDASPIHHVAAAKDIPPFLVCYSRGMGQTLNLARRTQAEAFGKALRTAGISADVVDASDRNHGEVNEWFGKADDKKVTGRSMVFLRELAGDRKGKNPDRLRGAGAADQGTPEEPDLTSLVRFTRDYVPGTRDANGLFMGGVELMRLASHRGHLYAALGYATDRPGADPSPGAQILVKRGPTRRWQVDQSFPAASRVNTLEAVTFVTDHAGRPLSKPVGLLVADASSFALSRQPRALVCLVRNDRTGRWEESAISPRAPRAYVRAFGSHRDRETGIDLIFAGTGAGEIYAGAYDPAASGRIRWNPKPEYTNPAFSEEAAKFKRVSAFCEANGEVFCSVAPCLVRRVDGKEPRWQEVFRWEVAENKYGAGLRGITAITTPGRDHEVIVGSRERPGKILRIDPMDGFKAEVELDSRAFLREEWRVQPIGSGLTAYNRFVPGKHPRTGKPIHWVTVAAMKPGDTNAAWLLIRNADASYELIRVFDPKLDEHPRLLSTRTLEIAPWNDREIYTGGYDLWGNRRRNHNTAWILKGTLCKREQEP